MGFKEFIITDRFKDKVTIVTGGGSGICRETALRFAKEGSSLVIPDINFEGAKETAKLVEEIGRKALPLSLDVSDTESVREMVRRTIDIFGKIDLSRTSSGKFTGTRGVNKLRR